LVGWLEACCANRGCLGLDNWSIRDMDTALPGDLCLLGVPLLDIPSLLDITMVGTRSVLLLWAVWPMLLIMPFSSPSVLLSSPCAEAVLLALKSPPAISLSALLWLLSNMPGPVTLLLPQYPDEESILGSISLGAELPNANSILPLEFFLWVSKRPSLSRFLANIASRLSSSDLSISFRLSSTCCLLSISLLLSSSICLLRSFSCCSRNFCACRACCLSSSNFLFLSSSCCSLILRTLSSLSFSLAVDSARPSPFSGFSASSNANQI